jgi:hypothetical protein
MIEERIFSFFNKLYYFWRRTKWRLDLYSSFKRYENVQIQQPIFLLGNQGAGLTLVSRMLRRHPKVVSITGDHTYWAGAGEMQNVMRCRLPASLRLGGRYLCRDVPHERFTPPRSWSYACDDLVDAYRKTEHDVNATVKKTFQKIIREALHRFGGAENEKRFIDKSQVFTLKMSYINALLAGTEPHFILITRNPYASVYRAALGKAGDMKRYAEFLSLDERVRICAQHWRNAMRAVQEDREKVSHFTHLRFEDVLENPRESVQELCAFLKLPFREDMLPHPDHEFPLGSRYRDRWYPLRPEVNQPYLESIPNKYIALVDEHCQPLAEKWGYVPPAG